MSEPFDLLSHGFFWVTLCSSISTTLHALCEQESVIFYLCFKLFYIGNQRMNNFRTYRTCSLHFAVAYGMQMQQIK